MGKRGFQPGRTRFTLSGKGGELLVIQPSLDDAIARYKAITGSSPSTVATAKTGGEAIGIAKFKRVATAS